MIIPIFFVSGAISLGYQVLWSRMILSFLGVGAYSYAIVLSTFMAGLALGSAWIGRWADRVRRPLVLFAGLEMGVGLLALAFDPAADWARSVYLNVGIASNLWIKAAVSSILILPPTILMGGTYPALLKFSTTHSGSVGSHAARLYAANAAGAAFGALLTAYVLMPAMGISSSLLVLAAGNAIVATLSFVLSTSPLAKGGMRGVDQFSSTGCPQLPSIPDAGRQASLALLLIFLSGLVSFSYEIAWTRFFEMVLGSSTYSFAVMLAAFTLGIAVGNLWLARHEGRFRRPIVLFGWTQILAATAVMAPIPLYPVIPWTLVRLGALFPPDPAAFYGFEILKLGTCLLIMLLPTLLIGMSVPLMVKGLAGRPEMLGADCGRIYAWNTWGNVAGAALTGLFLLPWIGADKLIRAGAVANALIGAIAILMYLPKGNWRPRLAKLSAVGLAAGLAGISIWIDPWNPAWFTLAPFRRHFAVATFDETRTHLARTRVLMAADDPSAHVMVTSTEDRRLTLYVNGRADASSHANLPTQILLAHLPILLHPAPQDVCIVGLGSGITAGAALAHPVRRADVVELVRILPQAAALFDEWNNGALSDTRCRIIINDARDHLSAASHKYDVLISQPSNLWVAGTGYLFSREFYERSRSSLNTGGLFCQWLQSFEIGDATLSAAIRSFRLAYPYVYVFQINVGDLLLIGGMEPLRPDWPAMRKRMERPLVKDQLNRIRITNLSDLLFFQRLSPHTVDGIAAVTPREHTDDNLLIESMAPKDLFLKRVSSLPFLLDERRVAAPSLLWSQCVREAGAPLELPTPYSK